MGLSKGPDWKDDSFNYINSQVSELEMHHDEFNEFFEDNCLYISINDKGDNGHES